jgi:putative DNA methylase
MGSATALPGIEDGTLAAVVVDPPYDDNVQYSELADFFYVWLKRTQGHRHPDWFATYLCEHDEEAVVNISRFRDDGETAKAAKEKARQHYRELMTGTFRECHRVLQERTRPHGDVHAQEAGGVGSTLHFTHSVGLTITATWPIKTESENSLHQAKKNAAQSTVFPRSPQARPRSRHRATSTAQCSRRYDSARNRPPTGCRRKG